MGEGSNDSTFIRHCPCTSCGSSDAGALYTDGHVHCHKCGAWSKGDGTEPQITRRKLAGLIAGKYSDLNARRLTEETCRKWDYTLVTPSSGRFAGREIQAANYRDSDGDVVAQKLRGPGKDFSWTGNPEEAGLYGQHLWHEGGKYLVVTEGEIDAMSVSQIQDHKWPVVSLPNGAKAAKKSLSKAIEWLETFENVVLMFDNDADGQAAAKECVELFSPGKCRIATLPLKDANDMLKAGRGSEVVSAMWSARVARPDGIVSGEEVWERLIKSPPPALTYPWAGLNKRLGGSRLNEMVMWWAGSGVGKSEACAQAVAYHFAKAHNERIGYIALEEPVRKTALRLLSIDQGKRLNLNPDLLSKEELRTAFDSLIGDRIHFYDHYGSVDSTHLFNKIRYMVKACGCSTIILDHISIMVSGIAEGEERRLIDNAMTKLSTLTQELPMRLHVISHLRKSSSGEDKTHEEGGRVTLDDGRGSGTLKQLPWDIIALERNQQSESKKHLTRVRVLKCRETGDTGPACVVRYDPESGRLKEVDEAFEDSAEAFRDESNKDY